MEFLVTGDVHGEYERLEFLKEFEPESMVLIILGDAGFNFWLNNNEKNKQKKLNSYRQLIYCVRGNHEERPENLPETEVIYDENVNGNVYYNPEIPYIRYFMDGDEYLIEGYKALVIGGAYSVDKYVRLIRGWPWFKDEQLTAEERDKILNNVKGKKYDFVLTHTCPYTMQPFDLFLSGIDQSRVDNSMEYWLEEVKNNIEYRKWLFGHFHDDREVPDNGRMLFKNVKTINMLI